MENATEINYKPFEGDGRRTAHPTYSLPRTQPITVTNSQARLLIRHYVENKSSVHSPQAGTLWVIILWCHTHHKPYRLTAVPGLGYQVEPYENPVVKLSNEP